MSNTGIDQERLITVLIEKITFHQSEVETYTTLLEETYKAQAQKEEAAEKTQVARAATASGTGNESDTASEYLSETESGHYVFAPDGFTCHFQGPETDRQARKLKATEERQRIESTARLNFFTRRIEELQEQEKRRQGEAERKPAAKEPSSHTPQSSYASQGKRLSQKDIKYAQAQAQARHWAEARKPNPKVWCSPANQRAIREQKQVSAQEKNRAEYELKRAKRALVEQEQITLTKQKQLNDILAEFQEAITRAERLPTRPLPRYTPPRTPPTNPDHSSDESRESQP